MKTTKKTVKKPLPKGKGVEAENSKKPKLKPLNPKENKNWKNKLEEDEEEDLDLQVDEFDEFGSSPAFDENFDEDDDRF